MPSETPDLSVAQQAVGLVKEVATILHGEAKAVTDKIDEKAPEVRGGPLHLVGRLYVALTTIAALTASASAYFDTKGEIRWTTHGLRAIVGLSVAVGLYQSMRLVGFLVKRHPLYLSSPTEFSAAVHQTMITMGDPESSTAKSTDEIVNMSHASARPAPPQIVKTRRSEKDVEQGGQEEP